MPFTATPAVSDAYFANIELGLGGTIIYPPLTAATPATLVVEVAFPNDPIDLAGYRNLSLFDAPVSYWRMDNTASLVDMAGSGNTMTIHNTPTLVSSALSGDSNQATLFNGTTQDGTVPDAPSLNPTGNLTLKSWLQFAAAPGATKMIAGKTKSWWLELRTDSKVQLNVRKGSTVTTLVGATALSTATWYEIVGVYDGSFLRIYVNGVQDASTAYSTGVDTYPLNFTVARADDSTASPGFRGFRTASTSSLGSTIGLNTPAATVLDDYMICVVSSGGPNTVTPPAGWDFIGQITGSAANSFGYGRRATAGDVGGAGSYTWTFGTAQSAFYAQMVAMSSVGTIPTAAVTGAVATATSVSTNLTPIFSNTTVLGFFVATTGAGTWTLTPGTKQYEAEGQSVSGETITVGAPSSQTVQGTTPGSGNKAVLAIEVVGTIGASTFSAIRNDEVSYWDKALSPTQIAAHYAAASVAPTTVVWTDISADVRECRIARGRQFELDQIQAGTATLLLKDSLRKYDPGNALGPNAPNVKPLRQIRIRALFNAVNYPLFRGYVERWESRWETSDLQSYAEVEVSCVDGFAPLSLASPSGSVPAGLSGSSVGALLSRANWPADQRVIDTGAFNVVAITLDGSSSALAKIQDVARGEGGVFFMDAAGNAVFHDKNHRTTASLSTTSQALFGDVPDGSLPYQAVEQPGLADDRIVNDWRVADSAGVDHQAIDQTSINTFFRRTGSLDTLLSATDATTMAAFLLARTKDPGYRFESLQLAPNNALEVWTQALNREISDRITVERQPVGKVPGSQIKRDFWIERVEWTWRFGEPTLIRWQLSPAA